VLARNSFVSFMILNRDLTRLNPRECQKRLLVPKRSGILLSGQV
jgi:hypothetical protein